MDSVRPISGGDFISLRRFDMRTRGISLCGISARKLCRGGSINWRKSMAVIALLAGATGITLAQRGDAFLPNEVKSAKNISTVPANGDVNPYGVAFVPEN